MWVKLTKEFQNIENTVILIKYIKVVEIYLSFIKQTESCFKFSVEVATYSRIVEYIFRVLICVKFQV